MSQSEEKNKFKEDLRRGEYETQLFELTSFCLVHEFAEYHLSLIRNRINLLRQKLFEESKNPEEHKLLENILTSLQEKYERATRAQFKRIEPKILQIFNIPAHILLPEDEVQKHQYTVDDFKKIDDEIMELKSRYRRAIHLKSMFEREKETYSNLTIIEKRKLQLEDSVNRLSEIYTSNKDIWKKTSDDLNNLIEEIGKINIFLKDTSHFEVDEKILLDKIL